MSAVAFIGLGLMGQPMARNLLKGGHIVRAFDVRKDAMTALANEGAVSADSPADAAAGAEYIFTMLPSGKEVNQAVFGENGFAQSMNENALFIDTSTILPADTDEISAKLAANGRKMLDAPVGRLAQNAIEGTLLFMVGGPESDLENARPLLNLLGNEIVHCGAVGMGTRMKIVNNYQSTSLNILTAETLTLAEASGLDVKLAIKVMSETTAGRGHMSATYPKQVLSGNIEPGFMIDLAHKDLGLALETTAALRTPAFLGAAARQAYSIAQSKGQGRKDWTSVYLTLKQLAGLDT
ncbi:MAG: sulfolactaldehyde 3-reductase [Nitrospinaceae bacterium]|nr:sulfolactaldehyde 3-reductase [Gammaproteobacteria bacterium]